MKRKLFSILKDEDTYKALAILLVAILLCVMWKV